MTINVTNGSLTSISGALSAQTNQFLPESVSVTGASATYSGSTGAYSISSITGSIINFTAVGEWAFECTVNGFSGYQALSGGSHTLQVRACAFGYAIGELSEAIPFDIPYSVSYSLTGCSVSASGGGSSGRMFPGETLVLNITEYSGYELPDSATVTGATSVYNKNNKTLTLSNPTGNVSVTITCTIVGPASYNVTLDGAWDSFATICAYDGQGISGTLLYESNPNHDSSGSFNTTVTVESGYIYINDNTTGGGAIAGCTCSGGVSATGSYYTVTGDGSITGIYSDPCLIAGTKIMLADGSEKNIEDISYSDDILVRDFYNRCYTSAKPMWIKKKQTTSKYDKVVFSDGSWLGVVGQNGNTHRVFNFTKQEFLYPKDCIGDDVFTYEEAAVTIESITEVNETVDYYNVITGKHYNLFANGILTSCRLSNRYAIEGMKYDLSKVKMTEEEVQSYIDNLAEGVPKG